MPHLAGHEPSTHQDGRECAPVQALHKQQVSYRAARDSPEVVPVGRQHTAGSGSNTRVLNCWDTGSSSACPKPTGLRWWRLCVLLACGVPASASPETSTPYGREVEG